MPSFVTNEEIENVKHLYIDESLYVKKAGYDLFSKRNEADNIEKNIEQHFKNFRDFHQPKNSTRIIYNSIAAYYILTTVKKLAVTDEAANTILKSASDIKNNEIYRYKPAKKVIRNLSKKIVAYLDSQKSSLFSQDNEGHYHFNIERRQENNNLPSNLNSFSNIQLSPFLANSNVNPPQLVVTTSSSPAFFLPPMQVPSASTVPTHTAPTGNSFESYLKRQRII